MSAKQRIIRITLIACLLPLLSGCVAVTLGAVVVTASAVHDRRSVETVVDDRLLNVAVRDALFGEDAFGNESRIKISVYNGWVLLAGEVGNEAQVSLATERVVAIEGVRKLFNELAPIPPAGLTQASRDRLLSIQVKAAVADIKSLPGFDASRVKVTSARGEVYLQGLLTTQESLAVTERVSRVSGVEKVVVLFEALKSD